MELKCLTDLKRSQVLVSEFLFKEPGKKDKNNNEK
jgi:hypothetical protein